MKTIFISRPKIVADYKCPKCKHIDIVALPEVTTSCKNCKTKVTTPVEVNITFSVYKDWFQKLANDNEVVLKGEIYNSDITDVTDSLGRFGNHDDDIYNALLSLQNNIRKHQCFEVSEITIEDDLKDKTSCKECGYCFNCKRCKACGQNFVPKEVSTKEGKQKRYTCPNCGAKDYDNSYIETVKIEDKKKVCPHCKSDRICFSNFPSSFKSCPTCGTDNIHPPKQIKVYKLVTRRQPRFKVEEKDASAK